MSGTKSARSAPDVVSRPIEVDVDGLSVCMRGDTPYVLCGMFDKALVFQHNGGAWALLDEPSDLTRARLVARGFKVRQ